MILGQNDIQSEGYINFKKPQNEIFKKLDGKIQKIVAAHSNLNKLYALNDFSSLGVGPKRPFELPPQLPPPPPWVPKVNAEYGCAQWNQDFGVPRLELPEFNMTPSPKTKQPNMQEVIPNERPKLWKDPNDEKRFQKELVAMLKQEINAMAQSANLKFISPIQNRQRLMEKKSLLSKSSPQTLFNTIRRETSLLLNRRELTNHQVRQRLSLLSEQQPNNHQDRIEHRRITQYRPLINKLHQTIKVVVPPTANMDSKKNEARERFIEKQTSPTLTYQVIRNKVRSFREIHPFYLGRANIGLHFKTKTARKLDSIVDRLKAKSGTPSPAPVMSNPTPIPVFRGGVTATNPKGCRMGQKSELHPNFGLKIGNYLEKECPQPNNNDITIDTFAKCLNLVRPNDASLRRKQEQLLQSELKWKFNSNRPLRLRRLNTRRAGLSF